MLPKLTMILATVAVIGLVVAWIASMTRIDRLNLRSMWEYATANFAGELGALTLAQAALLSQNDLQRGVIEVFVQESPVLEVLPMLDIEGNAFAYNKELTLPGVEFRAVNAGYTESTGTIAQSTESLVILGGDADVDRFIVQTRGNLQDQRAVQTRLKVKAAVYKFQDTFINGDTAVDANSFDGLKKRLTGAQVVDAATNGLLVNGADDAARHAFLDKLDELIAAVDGPVDALYMNATIRARLKSSARRIGGWDMTRNDFGRTIESYNGIPLEVLGQTAAGVEIIPQTETQGSSSIASSIYAVRFGEDPEAGGVTGLTNGGVQAYDLGEIDTKPVYRTRLEFYTGLAVFGRSAARLRGVLA